MKKQVPLSAVLALAMLVQASPSQAEESGQQLPPLQQPQEPTGPFRGLFGGSQAGSESRQALSFVFSTLGGYDDNLYAQSGVVPPGPHTQVGGAYAGLQAELDYVRRGRRVSFRRRRTSGSAWSTWSAG